MAIPGVEGLSTCTPCPTGPSIDRRTTEELVPMLPVRSMTEPSQCMKVAFVTDSDKPTLTPVPSGGVVTSTPITWSVDESLSYVRYVYENDLSGDIASQMPAVAEVQARLAAVLLGDAFARDLWADPAAPNFTKNMPYFASQNPNGVATPAAGTGTAPTRRDLLCLRRKIEPHPASSRIVYVMNTAMLDALDRSTYQDGYPLDWRPDVDGVTRPHLSGLPILLSDNVAVIEPGGGSSVYAVRLPDLSDAFGTDGVHLVVPPGETGVQIFSAPESQSSDNRQFRAQMNRMPVSGGRTNVARTKGFAANL